MPNPYHFHDGITWTFHDATDVETHLPGGPFAPEEISVSVTITTATGAAVEQTLWTPGTLEFVVVKAVHIRHNGTTCRLFWEKGVTEQDLYYLGATHTTLYRTGMTQWWDYYSAGPPIVDSHGASLKVFLEDTTPAAATAYVTVTMSPQRYVIRKEER